MESTRTSLPQFYFTIMYLMTILTIVIMSLWMIFVLRGEAGVGDTQL